MGISESPLRDRVVFVEGAPRSGTTWLVTLLATHPEIAGVQAESHLFDFGTDRLFDNLEHRHPTLHGLSSYLQRDQLVDIVRDLCDGVFLAMRSNVAGGADATFVVEKTPAAARADGLDLVRKAECYPDAWYVHLVRDREAVARSLMRAPWMPDRSYEACSGLWDRQVGRIRTTFGDLPRYREVSYEALRADPAAACEELFAWLGVSSGDQVLDTVRRLSREPFSELGVPRERSRSRRDRLAGVPARLRARVGAALDGVERVAPEAPGNRLGFAFAVALRQRDAEALRSLTAPSFELEYRSPVCDEVLRDDEARAELVRIAEAAFDRKHVGEWWAAPSGGPGEWWTNASGRPVWTIVWSAIDGDATRVDVAFALVLDENRIRRAIVISAGPLTGRPLIAKADGPA